MLRVTEDFAKCFKVTRTRSLKLRKLGYGFLFASHSNHGSIWYHFRDKAIYWPKIAIFHTPPILDAPTRRVAVGIFPGLLLWKN